MDDKEWQLFMWRIGHHIEAAAKIVGGSIMALAKSVDAQNVRWDRIASAMERENMLREQEVQLRREHVMYVLEQRDLASRAAERIMGLGGPFAFTREPGEDRKEPDWLQDVLGCKCAETDGKGCPIPAHQPVEP